MTKVLIQCPCCNTVLQVEVTPLHLELVNSCDVDKEAMRRGMEKILQEMPQYSSTPTNKGLRDTLKKWNPGQPGQYEEDIYHDYEIARLRKEITTCPCKGGPCGDCQERHAVLNRLLAHKDQLTDKAKGQVACPHCQGAKSVTFCHGNTDTVTQECPVCCGTGTVYQTTLRKVEEEGK